jgi:hypothetical protein
VETRDHQERITSLAWSPSGTKFAIALFQDSPQATTLRIVDAASSVVEHAVVFNEQTDSDNGWLDPTLAWHPSGTKLACSTHGGVVRVVDGIGGSFEVIDRPWSTDDGRGSVLEVAWNP